MGEDDENGRWWSGYALTKGGALGQDLIGRVREESSQSADKHGIGRVGIVLVMQSMDRREER
jgi:hypothetical protein